MEPPPTSLKTTPLTAAHQALGARLVGFAGYAMPLNFVDGILKEHLWTREHAGLFDVSHMGPAFLEPTQPSGDPEADHRRLAGVIEPLVSGEITSLAPGRLRYTLMLNRDGGILDDLMVGRDPRGKLFLVVNAGTKEADFAAIAQAAAGDARLLRADDQALIALQGPQAADVLEAILPAAGRLRFMDFAAETWAGLPIMVSRSGYTGEDGFEILVPAEAAEDFAGEILADDRVRLIGLGARDSLRLEAGLPLYGHDLDETVSPIEAGLAFAVSRKRLRSGSLRGAERLARELAGGPSRRRIGLSIEGAPAREGAEIAQADGRLIGRVTSGGFSPSLQRPIALGFVDAGASAPFSVTVRGRAQLALETALPFVPHRYHR